MSPFDLAGLREKSEELNKETIKDGFWDDSEAAQSLLKKKSSIDNKISQYEELEKGFKDIEELIVLAEEMDDEDEADLIVSSFYDLNKRLESFKLATLLNGKYDHNSAILSVHAGTGGVDAMDWAEMLLRMYTRWAESKGYGVTVVDIQDDTEAGIKSATFLVEGENAYGYLKNEKGVHRLVRISPFNAAGKRQTSFAALEVMELTGTVRNVVDFGAFVDIGVKQDGLVHVSQMSKQYVNHPMDVVSVGDTVKVKILSIDREKQKVSLTMII